MRSASSFPQALTFIPGESSHELTPIGALVLAGLFGFAASHPKRGTLTLPARQSRTLSGLWAETARDSSTPPTAAPHGSAQEVLMALADRLSEIPRRNHGLPCSVGVLLETLPESEADALREMLGTPERRSPWAAQDIYEALRDEGHEVGYQTINRHRGGKCRCGK